MEPDTQMVDVFSALGDPHRLSMVARLSVHGALSATVLAKDVSVTRQAIVRHLKVLQGAGLVTAERRGREVVYGLRPRRLAEARTFIESVSASWDQALERLRRMVETDEP